MMINLHFLIVAVLALLMICTAMVLKDAEKREKRSHDENCYGDFRCGDYFICVPLEASCDGVIDCPDGIEERGCPGCPDDHFKCRSGECIRFSEVCDRGVVRDCKDKSDETGCHVNNKKKRMSKPEGLERSEKYNITQQNEQIIKSKRKEQQRRTLLEKLEALDEELKERIGN